MRTGAAWAKLDRAQGSLEQCELFQDLSTRELMEVAALAEEIQLKADTLLLKESEPARYLYIVLEGRGVAQLKMGGAFLSLGLVGPEDAAGWSSMVEDQTYPASVRALSPMRVARIDAGRLARLMELDTSMGYSVGKRLSLLFCGQYKGALEAFRTSK
jgi:CRP-like cAMP-binding protein